MRAPSPQGRRKRPTRLTTCLTQCRSIDSLSRSAERMTASIKRQKAQRSNAMMRLASYAITVAIHFFTITRLTIIDRRGSGCSCGITSRPIVTGLRCPRSYKPQANTNGLHKLDKPGPSVCRGSYAPRASQNAQQASKYQNAPPVHALLRAALLHILRRWLDGNRLERLSKRHRTGLS